MKEWLILFSTPMVLAILEGRKTQTRRIVKEPYQSYPCVTKHLSSGEFDFYYDQGIGQFTTCPYGQPGDILWVKEMYYAYGIWLKNGHTKSGKQKWRFFDTTLTGFKYHYVEDPPENVLPNTVREKYGWFKRSSLFMPRKACRIKLEITDRRVERLQDISEEDAIAEGIQTLCNPKISETGSGERFYNENDYPIDHYETLWESVNGKGSWDLNPWVWCISFKRL